MKSFFHCIFLIIFVRTCQAQVVEAEKLEEAKGILETAQTIVEEASDAITKITEAVGKTSEVFTKFSKFVTALGPVFMCVSAVISITSLFVPKAESEMMSAIKEGFEQVNQKVDAIVDATEELKIVAELSNAKLSIIPNLDIIKSLNHELLIARYLNTKDAWDHYKKRFQNEYNHASSKFYSALIGPKSNGDFRLDFLDLFSKKMKCSPNSIAKLCVTSMQTINKGLDIEAAFFGAIKYTSRVRVLRIIWERRLEKLRARCIAMIKKCEDQAMNYAGEVFSNYFHQAIPAVGNEQFAQKAYEIISNMFTHLKWAVWISDDIGINDRQLTFKIPDNFQRYRIQQAGKITFLLSVDFDYSCENSPERAFNEIEQAIAAEKNCFDGFSVFYVLDAASKHTQICTDITKGACFGGFASANQAIAGKSVSQRRMKAGFCVFGDQHELVFC